MHMIVGSTEAHKN